MEVGARWTTQALLTDAMAEIARGAVDKQVFKCRATKVR